MAFRSPFDIFKPFSIQLAIFTEGVSLLVSANARNRSNDEGFLINITHVWLNLKLGALQAFLSSDDMVIFSFKARVIPKCFA